MVGSNENFKIDLNYLEKINKDDHSNKFGNWINNIVNLSEEFLSGKPFENVVIDNFLNESYAEELYRLFPKDRNDWHYYENPIEVKYAFDNINNLDSNIKDYFYYLSSEQITKKISEITNIPDLQYDEYLHGAGLHSHPRHGRLNVHLDYEKHPFSGKERRINIIYFLTKNWNSELWNGLNELWDKEVSICVKKTDIIFNRAIIFKTNDISWHGLPEKILCPENVFRNSIAYYYVSLLNSQKNEDEYRKKAKFVKRPQDSYNKNMEELYNIRRYRRIEKTDMELLFPNWKKEN
jgi:hypothetical protein